MILPDNCAFERRRWVWAAIVGICLLGMQSLASAAPGKAVARVVHLKGKVTVSPPRSIRLFGTIYDGEKITLGPDSEIVLGFRANGRLERCETSGTLTVTASGCEPKSSVVATTGSKRAQQLASQAVRRLPAVTKGGATVVRSGPNEAPPAIEPIAKSTVLKIAPTFRWPVAKDAAKYEVVVYNGRRRAWGTFTEKLTTQYAGRRSLRRGYTYTWEVVATLKDGTVKRLYKSDFTVALEETVAEAAELAELAKEAPPQLLTLVALRYEQNGLVADALAVYQRLVKADPTSADLHAAVFRMASMAGQTEIADKARRRAEELGFKFADTENAEKPKKDTQAK